MPRVDDFNEAEFERDFCVALNMMMGKPYEEALIEAKQWVEDAKETPTVADQRGRETPQGTTQETV